jgi:hypothetical protein
MFSATINNHAQFFSVWELKTVLREILGPVPVSWRTVCQLPTPSGRLAHSLERNRIIQRCPFGAFAGMVVALIPRFKTKPLAMRYRTKHTTGTATG